MTGLRWGILATGGIAHAFTEDLRLAGLDVVAVGSRSEESARRFAETFGIPHAHGSYEQLVADPDVDIVYVASPHSHHMRHAALALQHGKHALVEKAFTMDRDEAVALRDLAADNGLLVMEAMWTRYLPHMVRIRELVASGALGEVRVVSAEHTNALSTDPAHRLNALGLGGGALLDLGIYPISFVWDVLGEPDEVRAVARFGDTGADTELVTAMTHASGAVSSTVSSLRTLGPNTAHVLGTEARIDIDDRWYMPTSFRVVRHDGTVVEEHVSTIEGRGMQFEAFEAERLVAEGRRTGEILPIDETVAIMGTLDEIRRQIGLSYPGEA